MVYMSRPPHRSRTFLATPLWFAETVFAALRCSSCREVFRPEALRPGVRRCARCEETSLPEPRRVTPPLRYEGVNREVVLAAKVHGSRRALRFLADELATTISTDLELAGTFRLVTWAPTTDRRRRRRGFDQSEFIARLVARRLGVPCRRLLVREAGPPQTGATRRERLVGPRFRARVSRGRIRGRVLVVDDVITTGSTLRAAAHALEVSGWSDVVVAACASTPDDRRSIQTSPANRRTVAMAED